MDQFEMQQALKIAKDREQAHRGAMFVSTVVTCVYAYYSPSWLWFQGYGAFWPNLAVFCVIAIAISAALCKMVDKVSVDKRPDQSKA